MCNIVNTRFLRPSGVIMEITTKSPQKLYNRSFFDPFFTQKSFFFSLKSFWPQVLKTRFHLCKHCVWDILIITWNIPSTCSNTRLQRTPWWLLATGFEPPNACSPCAGKLPDVWWSVWKVLISVKKSLRLQLDSLLTYWRIHFAVWLSSAGKIIAFLLSPESLGALNHLKLLINNSKVGGTGLTLQRKVSKQQLCWPIGGGGMAHLQAVPAGEAISWTNEYSFDESRVSPWQEICAPNLRFGAPTLGQPCCSRWWSSPWWQSWGQPYGCSTDSRLSGRCLASCLPGRWWYSHL